MKSFGKPGTIVPLALYACRCACALKVMPDPVTSVNWLRITTSGLPSPFRSAIAGGVSSFWSFTRVYPFGGVKLEEPTSTGQPARSAPFLRHA